MQFINKEVVKEYVHKYFSVLGELLSVPFMDKGLAFFDIPPKKGRNIKPPIVIYWKMVRVRGRH